jgi:hypothetical protein
VQNKAQKCLFAARLGIKAAFPFPSSASTPTTAAVRDARLRLRGVTLHRRRNLTLYVPAVYIASRTDQRNRV